MTAGLFDDSVYAVKRTQVEAFIAPPTSVLDAQQGYWQDRRDAWAETFPVLRRGVAEGRTDLGSTGLAHFDMATDPTSLKIAAAGSTVTEFDPVLAEVAYSWWTVPGDEIYDPFAGGPTRGLVAAALGRSYIGCDVREEQVDANEDHAINGVRWVAADSSERVSEPCDFIFSCPPYGNLERYSDDPRDLSTMTWEMFVSRYERAVELAVGALRRDRFAAFVVGNFKERRILRDLCGLTVHAFARAGADYYSDAVLIPPGGSAALRAASSFPKNRRPVARHQFLLTFVKGDAGKAASRLDLGGVA